ncbi:hypothetical protein QFC24_003824 [Naganishia onofrii]|uniref:Uncharacterized protein n=1 Tax=Naganishia onofrii TaxID=1851511 RepID=A0ACC2XHW1_9TREE|nr:hypothetical protein QFC24_003824 [Naganishia onofrii]
MMPSPAKPSSSHQQNVEASPPRANGYNHTFEARYAGPSLPNANDGFMGMIRRRAEGQSGLGMVVDTQGVVPTIRWQGGPGPSDGVARQRTGSEASRRPVAAGHQSSAVPLPSNIMIRESTFDPLPNVAKVYPPAVPDWSTMSAMSGSIDTVPRTVVSCPPVMQTPSLRAGHAAVSSYTGGSHTPNSRRPLTVKPPPTMASRPGYIRYAQTFESKPSSITSWMQDVSRKSPTLSSPPQAPIGQAKKAALPRSGCIAAN